MTTAMQTVQTAQAGHQLQQYAEPKPLTAAELKRTIGVIQTVLKEVMKRDVHYGVVPGTQQTSLLKPGAEKIAATFRLAPDYMVEDLSSDDEARYRVTCRLVSVSGVFVGSGLGEASTSEQKYRWRAAVCKEEFEATDESRRRVKYGKARGGGFYTQQQVRQEPADLANTVLKMAAKRALVAAVITATGASDIFAQDIEDLPPEVREELMGDYGDGQQPEKKPLQKASGSQGRKPPPAQPRSRSESAADDAASKAADDNGLVRPNQVKQIESKCGAMGVEVSALLAAFEIDALEKLKADQFRDALEWVSGEGQ